MSRVDWESPRNILMVEDNPGDVRLIQEALKEIPLMIEMSVARDGQQALDMLGFSDNSEEIGLPQIILLDLNLPVRSGQEVLNILKSDLRTRGIPVVIFSSSGADQDIKQSYENHANCYISKPVNLDDYLHVIRESFDFWLNRAVIPGAI
jgi:two-component system, chemotaxis family, response regulator Rcp1